jgi:hypothetical protein
MTIVGDVACPRCGEDRVTMITEVIDPMGRRYFCCLCALEFRVTGRKDATEAGADARISSPPASLVT